MPICTSCGLDKIVDAFPIDYRVKKGWKTICKECARRYARENCRRRMQTPELARQIKNTRLQGDYGITLAEYEQMYVEQEGRCAICNISEAILVVDHCHTSHIIRGLLCTKCNLVLGQVKEDPQILRRATEYLEKERPPVDLYRLLMKLR